MRVHIYACLCAKGSEYAHVNLVQRLEDNFKYCPREYHPSPLRKELTIRPDTLPRNPKDHLHLHSTTMPRTLPGCWDPSSGPQAYKASTSPAIFPALKNSLLGA